LVQGICLHSNKLVVPKSLEECPAYGAALIGPGRQRGSKGSLRGKKVQDLWSHGQQLLLRQLVAGRLGRCPLAVMEPMQL